MRTFTHIRHSATRVAGLSLMMALFGLIATTWVDQMSSRDLGCCDQVRCGSDVSVLGLVPLTGGSDANFAPTADLRQSQPLLTTTLSFQNQLAARPIDVLTVAPKTSPPA